MLIITKIYEIYSNLTFVGKGVKFSKKILNSIKDKTQNNTMFVNLNSIKNEHRLIRKIIT